MQLQRQSTKQPVTDSPPPSEGPSSSVWIPCLKTLTARSTLLTLLLEIGLYCSICIAHISAHFQLAIISLLLQLLSILLCAVYTAFKFSKDELRLLFRCSYKNVPDACCLCKAIGQIACVSCRLCSNCTDNHSHNSFFRACLKNDQKRCISHQMFLVSATNVCKIVMLGLLIASLDMVPNHFYVKTFFILAIVAIVIEATLIILMARFIYLIRNSSEIQTKKRQYLVPKHPGESRSMNLQPVASEDLNQARFSIQVVEEVLKASPPNQVPTGRRRILEFLERKINNLSTRCSPDMNRVIIEVDPVHDIDLEDNNQIELESKIHQLGGLNPKFK